jgi:hypothetical protein
VRNDIVSKSENKERPVCFGDLHIVFPKSPDGLRVTPETCLRCDHKTQCLRAAMGGGSGLRVREEMIDRAYRGGMIGFFQRWSQKKSIQRMRKSDQSTS